MAGKMFYSAEEAAQKLGKSVPDVLEMAKKGEIQEFRDRDKVMFKAEQINLLAGDEAEGGEIPLALEDSRSIDSAIDLADSGPAKPAPKKRAPKKDLLADSSDETGIARLRRQQVRAGQGWRRLEGRIGRARSRPSARAAACST